ncbi:MAG: cell division protein SepF [Longicatena sp.]
MSITQKFKEFIAPMDEDDVLEVEREEEAHSISEYESPKSKAVNHLPQDTKMVLFEPRSFDEAEEIARRLKENKAAVINLHKLQRDYAQRTIDFLTGVIFALDGSIQKIGHNVILCTPKNVPVHGQIDLDASEED